MLPHCQSCLVLNREELPLPKVKRVIPAVLPYLDLAGQGRTQVPSGWFKISREVTQQISGYYGNSQFRQKSYLPGSSYQERGKTKDSESTSSHRAY